MKSIYFITKYSNNIHKIKLSKTLLHFIEYDFEFFSERCDDFYQKSIQTQKFDAKSAKKLRDMISNCHPYYESMIGYSYNNIVIDYIINRICKENNKTIQELWNHYISPKNSLQRELFTRLSKYKTNKATNEWQNLLKIQQYAKQKVDFLFNGQICSQAEVKIRSKYFDLGYTISQREIGLSYNDIPSVKKVAFSQLPNAVFMMTKLSKDIYRNMETDLENAPDYSKIKMDDKNLDKYAMSCYQFAKSIERPGKDEFLEALEAFNKYPDFVYQPNCFKAIIDLEISEMIDNGILYLKCEKCGKYFKKQKNQNLRICNRVNSSGKTCLEQYKSEQIKKLVGDEVVSKSENIYKNLNDKIGKDISEKELDEWITYFGKLIKNYKDDVASKDEIVSFLSQTEKLYDVAK